MEYDKSFTIFTINEDLYAKISLINSVSLGMELLVNAL